MNMSSTVYISSVKQSRKQVLMSVSCTKCELEVPHCLEKWRLSTL